MYSLLVKVTKDQLSTSNLSRLLCKLWLSLIKTLKQLTYLGHIRCTPDSADWFYAMSITSLSQLKEKSDYITDVVQHLKSTFVNPWSGWHTVDLNCYTPYPTVTSHLVFRPFSAAQGQSVEDISGEGGLSVTLNVPIDRTQACPLSLSLDLQLFYDLHIFFVYGWRLNLSICSDSNGGTRS
jgi:hypothetical protein